MSQSGLTAEKSTYESSLTHDKTPRLKKKGQPQQQQKSYIN
jgi:hypothetical protein